ncbi:MAG: EAL domain-containing protein, partial [Actinobacteria bacterium]|nr:EAL domain-containing protein [Actinomycetota bacterium]
FIGAVEGITSEVCVPLFDRGEVVGILNVESMGGVVLTEADLRLVSALAEQVGGAIGRARLYTRVRESEERLTYRAFHDPLTGLANRSLFLNRLEHARARAKRRKGRLAVLFMDLDNFKVINDSLGHDIGDRLLVTVAERLRTCVRPQDTVARLGGDEFVALLEDLADAGAAARVADRIMDELREPFEIDGHRLHTSASIGIALDAASGGDLLRAADTAMYRAKENGKGRYEVFREAMHDRAVERLRLENDLRAVLERDELAVHYQPKVSLHTGKVVGLEALLRWRHPEYGLLSPGDFMPLAEQTGLIVPIGRWVLLETCRQARAWQEIHPDNPPLMACVNLSVRQLQQTDFVAEILDETGLDPGSLVLEITEDAVMEDAQSAIGALKRLEGLGIKLTIDDFGTGYSSLSYLRTLPVDYLKIDRSFVERLGEDLRNAEIVSGTITLAHTLGLEVIAEGVENAVQLERLREMGCDLAQGNHFSRPLAAADTKRYLERVRASTP